MAAEEESMSERREDAKVGMLEAVASKSMSKPSTEAVPKGRRMVEEEEEVGPNMDQSVEAQVLASLAEAKPPSV